MRVMTYFGVLNAATMTSSPSLPLIELIWGTVVAATIGIKAVLFRVIFDVT